MKGEIKMILKDILFVNSRTLKSSWKKFINNWYIIFTGFIYSVINILLFSIINIIFKGPLVIITGFLMAIISSMLISNYLYLLYNVIQDRKVTFSDFKDGFTYYLRKVYGVFFIAWIFSFLIKGLYSVASGFRTALSTVITILIFVLFNPLPEIIYQKRYSPWESISYSLNFMKENWLNWILPNIIFSYILYKLTGGIITDIFITHISFGFDFSISGIIKYILGQVVFTFAMIYRGVMFDLLSNSTIRKRSYLKDMYK